MSEEGDQLEGELPLEGAGQRLRRAREEADMTIAQIAAETRIPTRHLETLESGDFAALPAKTYAVGFARTYARVVGLDEQEIATQVRSELAENGGIEKHRGSTFEPSDPARLPSRGLAWFSAFAVLILIIGSLAYFRGYFFPGSGPGSIVSGEPVSSDEGAGNALAAPEGAAPAPTGAVVFTSTQDGVWVKFYDASGERLMEKELARGESYTVPADADGPQVWTGQPEALAIKIGGTSIGTLSGESEIVRDIPVTAAALLARAAEQQEDTADEAPDGPANSDG